MAYEALRLTQESTFGVFPTSPAGGTQIDIFLSDSNAFGVRAQAKFADIRSSGQGNRKIRKIPGRVDVGGPLKTYLFPSQAVYLLNLATALVGSSPCYDLASFAADHVIFTDLNCTPIYRRYLGLKMAKANITCQDSDNGFLTMFNADIVGSTTATITGTDFPTPNLSAYPADDPFQFYHTGTGAGKLYIDSVRHDYYSLSIDVTNMLKGFGGENRLSQLVKYEGRDITTSVSLLLKSNADRAAYEAGTHRAVQIEFDAGTGGTLLFDFGTVNIATSVADDLPLGDKGVQNITFEALVDAAASPAPTDLTITYTPGS